MRLRSNNFLYRLTIAIIYSPLANESLLKLPLSLKRSPIGMTGAAMKSWPAWGEEGCLSLKDFRVIKVFP